jgi:iron(II)-dependent oxidoreductase
MLAGADALYDSSAVAHGARWDLPLPSPAATRHYLSQVLARVFEALQRSAADAVPGGACGLAFHATVCAQHEQMHAEAFGYSRQTLGYPALEADRVVPAPARAPGRARGDVRIEGRTFPLGARAGDGFVFDNEKWAHPVPVETFSISRSSTTCEAFAAFVDAGGYQTRHWWSDAGWAWRCAAGATGPAYWRRMLDRQGWEVRCNDQWRPLRADDPVLHVNAHEADAWCRWAERRLPTEAEWELAASAQRDPVQDEKRRHPWGDAAPDARRANLWFPGTPASLASVDAFEAGDSLHGCRQMTGNVWEWTASNFEAYPGFVADPYREYSEPWFGSHRVLRGGCFATSADIMRNTWRNFFTPDRRDVYAGFRSCARRDR